MADTVLDPLQRLAVFFDPDKSVIVEAPPGHGKTFVMARRIQYLIQSGWIKPPRKILGLTFSNVAASEMQDEIKARTQGGDLDLIRVMTFHSFGYKVLRAYGNLIRLDRNFQVIGEIDRSKIFQVVSARIDSKITEKQFLEWITETLIKESAQWKPLISMTEAEFLYQDYLEELGPTRLDYDSLLLKLLELFNKHPKIREIYRSVFKYILVDEFQDTNPLQFRVLDSLVFGNLEKDASRTPVFILADKEQAIYRFQGASLENIELAKNKFQCHEIVLDTNYRSNAEEILSFTKGLRDTNAKPSDKKVPFTISQTPSAEAQLIFDRISTYHGALDNTCVIAQSEYLLVEIRKLLDLKKIPYVFVPDFRSKSILRKYASIFSAISNLPNAENYDGKLSSKIRQIYASAGSSDANDDVLKALLQLAVKFDTRGEKATFSERARQFYNDIFIQVNWGALLRKTVKNKIFLSTIHGVKGLQFSQVHLCGLSCFEHIHHTTCIPCSWGRNKNSVEDSLDDAAKTLYVGTSRAQNELFLYSTSRSARGTSRKVLCLLKPYVDFLDISGKAVFCGD
jgi:superfamily I DNA/RNA helicase